ncbi:neuromedin-S isoform X2 [Hemicordylus capensis]|uniref:neuromedin-S isoform X2 n=1 Tax=Hemicordylus capensis TaxID=884348 RepID=UPI00230369F5|nr:neuromedin-S isoform X2 [Hemicordylus capensis]
MQKRRGQRNESLARPLTMKQPRPPPFPLIFGLYCICAVQFTAGFPQPFAGYLGESDIPTSERLALCFSQWTELSDQPQISSSVMDLCNSMFNGMQVDEEHKQEVFKRSFPVHPLMRLAPKLSERRMKRFLDPESSVLAAAEFTKKDGLDGLGRPFFLFRPRNGRTVNNGGE